MTKHTVETDILIVGGGPAGLAAAIHYADLVAKEQVPVKVMLLEKGAVLGNHTLSGAVINPAGLKELLPDIEDKDMPFDAPVGKDEVQFLHKTGAFTFPFHPPHMDNTGNVVVTLGKVVRWLGEIAEKKGVQVFSGFSAHEFLYEGGKVAGVRTGASGIDKHGKPLANYQPPTEVRAKITILAEGTRGSLTKILVDKLGLDKDRNPQVYSLGVKEVWDIPEGNFEAGRVIHTLGYPLNFEQFGGGFIYGLSKTSVAIGLVVGLDYKDPTFDVHHAFQLYKKHPSVAAILKNGKIVKYGAKTIPEGGFFSIPQLYHDNVMIVGDSAGLVAMPSLKGVHLAIRSGMLCAKAALEAIKKGDTSAAQLKRYQELFDASPVYKELHVVRNFRQAFQGHLIWGMLQFGTQIITGGRGLSLSGRQRLRADYEEYHPIKSMNGNSFLQQYKADLVFDKTLTFDKETDVFYSGTKHDEEQPSHIVVPSADTCHICIEKYDAPCQRFCPAQVFEIAADSKTGRSELKLHPSNCVHCKTCDIKDPYRNVTWVTPYGEDGPEYETM